MKNDMDVIDTDISNKYNIYRMLDSITVLAPAKVNLGLKVYPKREDGYHSIESIFVTANLADTITVSATDSENTCIVKCDSMVLPENNTFTAAYKAFCVLTGIKKGVLVEVTKRIPAGGGLGGGSSDASSFIKSIDILFGTHLKVSDYDIISGQVGSDVFFFSHALMEVDKDSELRNIKDFAAVVEGRGEIIRQIQPRNDFSLLLVLPGVSVSTKVAYTLVDDAITRKLAKVSNEKNGFIKNTALSLEQIYRKPVEEWSFVNDFTEPVTAVYPKIGQAIADLKSAGAAFADMSGSGSTVFGVFDNETDALKAKAKLSDNWQVVLA